MGGRWSATEVCRSEKITYGDQCLPSTVGPRNRTRVLMAGSAPLLIYFSVCMYGMGCVSTCVHMCLWMQMCLDSRLCRAQSRPSGVPFFHFLPHSLADPEARLTPSKSQKSLCHCPIPTVLGSQMCDFPFYVGAEDPSYRSMKYRVNKSP